MSAEDARHLHLDDYPQTLSLLTALLGHRSDQWVRSGYQPTEHGAWVNWETLTTEARLSSTEVAAVHIARGCATLERAGGLPAPLCDVVAGVVSAVSR